ncbi:MAG: class I SAM-dependent methyltransferase [Candidatus Binataceae bacterium]
MITFDHYGLLGLGHSKIIDNYLSHVPPNAIVVSLGCGPNLGDSTVNLVRAVAQNAPGAACLIFADIREQSVRNTSDALLECGGKVAQMSRPLVLDALSLPFRDSSVEMILALGLFGDPCSSGSQLSGRLDDKPVIDFTLGVLAECSRVLKPSGVQLISNSCKRQPLEHFSGIAAETGFAIADSVTGPVASNANAVDEFRYLLVLRKKSSQH